MYGQLHVQGRQYDKEPVHDHDPGSLTYTHPIKDEL